MSATLQRLLRTFRPASRSRGVAPRHRLGARTWATPAHVRLEGLEARTAPAIVTTTADSGPGSLRDALETSGSATFDLPGPSYTISLASPLTYSASSISISGSSQPGYAGTPIVHIDLTFNGSLHTGKSGSITGLILTGSPGAAVTISDGALVADNYIGVDATGTVAVPNDTGVAGGGGTIRGNVISGNTNYGIHVDGSGLIQDNVVGTNPIGTLKVPNGEGITISQAENNTITGNLISGNLTVGLRIEGTTVGNNVVTGNFIGTNKAGTAFVGNFGAGVTITGPNNVVGGPATADRNIITGNSGGGVVIDGGANTVQNNYIGTDVTGTIALDPFPTLYGVRLLGTLNKVVNNTVSGNAQGMSIEGDFTTIQGNFVGTDATGKVAVPNLGSGIDISTANNTVGGADPALRNIISGNGAGGLAIHDSMPGNNKVLGNYIGVDVTGAVALGNGGTGLAMHATAANTIGGLGAGEGNVISANGSLGLVLDFVDVPAAFANTIQGNIIGLNAAGTVALGNKGDGLFLLTVKNHTINNNTVGGNGGAGIKIGFNFPYGGNKVLNNVVQDNAGNGIEILGSASTTIAGNHVSSNGANGIFLSGGTFANTVQSNIIGTNKAGTAALPNKASGIAIIGSGAMPGGNLIGGASFGNLISGNGGAGITIADAASTNTIQGNTIGLRTGGAIKLGNDGAGVEILGTSAKQLIGGTAAGQGNVISGNVKAGVQIGPGSGGTHSIQGNRIGTNATGTAACDNGGGGIVITGSTGNLIGGTTAAARNLISGNTGAGISITDAADANTIQNNYIGTSAGGAGALGNTGPGIELLGTSAKQQIGGSTATGNVISGNGQSGIVITSTGGSHVVQGNVIGADPAGTSQVGNGQHGISISGSSANVIGGDDTQRNLISGNGSSGLCIAGGSADNIVRRNRIGTAADGNSKLANANNGVVYDGAGKNTLGGAGVGNVISGNGGAGVVVNATHALTLQDNFVGLGLDGITDVGNGTSGVTFTNSKSASVTGNVISGNGVFGLSIFANSATLGSHTITANRIGTSLDGMSERGNDSGGIVIAKMSGNVIGGATSSLHNVISGNGGAGLSLATSDANSIMGNYVGVAEDKSTKLGNAGIGVLIGDGSSNNTIGGVNDGEGNIIANNGGAIGRLGHGVVVETGTGNKLSRNSIYGNAGRGVDLAGDEVTFNDATDIDTGANNLQNFPVLLGVEYGPGGTRVVGTLTSEANKTYRLEFFANAAGDASGFGEGQSYLGFVDAFIDATGTCFIDATFTGILPRIVVNATDEAGNTSEFCSYVAVNSIDASLPSTKNAVTGDRPKPGVFTTSNQKLDFVPAATNDLLVTIEDDETLTIKAQGLVWPDAPVRWQIERNAADTVAAGTPTLNQLTGQEITLKSDSPGNFRLINYLDSNQNNTHDVGEELRVLRLAIVRITIQAGHQITTAATFSTSYKGKPAPEYVTTVNPMTLTAQFLLEGGGADGTIGTAKNQVDLGNIGNCVGDSFVVSFGTAVMPIVGVVPATEREDPDGRLDPTAGFPNPMLDAFNVPHGTEATGGANPFRGNSSVTDPAVNTGGIGVLRTVTSLDQPAYSWSATHATTGNVWAKTQGNNAFREYLVVYSHTFPHNYAALAKADWTVTINGKAGVGGIWQNTGSTVTLPGAAAGATTATLTVLLNGTMPQRGDVAGLQVRGGSFVSEYAMIAEPKIVVAPARVKPGKDGLLDHLSIASPHLAAALALHTVNSVFAFAATEDDDAAEFVSFRSRFGHVL